MAPVSVRSYRRTSIHMCLNYADLHSNEKKLVPSIVNRSVNKADRALLICMLC